MKTNSFKSKIRKKNGQIIETDVYVINPGSDQTLWVELNGIKHTVGNGNEFSAGYPKIFTLNQPFYSLKFEEVLTMKKKIKIELPNGEIIERVPNVEQVGNFQMIWVRYNNEKYIVNNGDEYLRGYPEIFTLGRKITE